MFLVKIMFKMILYTVSFPISLPIFLRRRYIIKMRRKNYEILGNYVAYFQNNPDLLRSLAYMIENNIRNEKFQQHLLQEVKKIYTDKIQQEKKEIEEQYDKKKSLENIIIEQQNLLAQSKSYFEQLKFREQVLEKLYEKAEKKYQE